MKIAFLGLGIMGSRMAATLVAAGHELTVWNRTPERAEEFAAQHGVPVAASPQAAATAADVVISMVVDGPQVEEILLGTTGAARGAGQGTLFIDCSTIGPDAARGIGAALSDRGQRFIDAPVTGSSPRAEDGTLTIMVGGRDQDFAEARPLLEAMGTLVVHAGDVGQGQVIKVINNTLAAINATAVGQALLAARASGADLEALITVVSAGSGASTMLDLKAKPMRDHDFATLFKLDHMLKDVRLCLAEVGADGPVFGLGEMAEGVLADASERGLGDADFSALIIALEDPGETPGHPG